MSTPASADLSDRYGVRRRSGFPWGTAIVIAVFALGVVFIGWLTLDGRDASPVSKDLSFTVVDASKTNVSVSVLPDTDRTVHCAIQALNSEYGVVGYLEVSVPPDPDRDPSRPAVFNETVRTTQLAVNGGIDKCWFGDGGDK
ncbi:DUF4307 domain-containing protein [Spelaeicoccus albus]|uniref:DUF4307 domain-containing protein n=1 Tax=Spelaeicoccus albus TaxID=1280376 RepID=A0A7Z0D343_9MICO|nr:DUF4307 domain-containing protein [Spelaeicoccus albus]NYI67993.1 hypothetical protein [Spelaeicoccus albus]